MRLLALFMLGCGSRTGVVSDDAGVTMEDVTTPDVSAETGAPSCVRGLDCALGCAGNGGLPGFNVHCITSCESLVCAEATGYFESVVACLSARGFERCHGDRDCLEATCADEWNRCTTARCP